MTEEEKRQFTNRLNALSDAIDELNYKLGKKTGRGSNDIKGALIKSVNFVSGSAGWQLTPDGDFEASSGTFRGALSGGTIQIGTGNDVFKADSNGIYLGNATFASAPFRVAMDGTLVVTSGTFSGTLQTAASGEGVYIGSNGKDRIDFLDNNGVNVGTLYGLNGDFYIYNSNNGGSVVFFADTAGGTPVVVGGFSATNFQMNVPLEIANTSTTDSINIIASAAGGRGMLISSINSDNGSVACEIDNDGGGRALYVHHDKPTATSSALNVTNAGTGPNAVFTRDGTTTDKVVAEFNQAEIISTNFKRILNLGGVHIWISDSTTPSGNLTGRRGDLCLNGPGGQPFYNNNSGTGWTAM